MSGQVPVGDIEQDPTEATHQIDTPDSPTTESDWVIVHDERFSEFRHYAQFLSSVVNLQYVLTRKLIQIEPVLSLAEITIHFKTSRSSLGHVHKS